MSNILPATETPTASRRASVTWRLPPREAGFANPEAKSGSEPSAVPVVKSLGLRTDAPRAVVKAIVKAAHSVDSSDQLAVQTALSAFNLAPLLKPDASVKSLASGIAGLARSEAWPQMVNEFE